MTPTQPTNAGQPPTPQAHDPEVSHLDGVVDTAPIGMLAVRGVIGGSLMGLANLVPGISGGTMLLASGVYTRFIEAVAEVSTLRFRRRSLVVFGAVMLMAGLAILLGAGPVKDFVVERRWVAYSLFIGLTLGGAPIVWKLARPVNRAVWTGCAVGFAVMVLTLLVKPDGSAPTNASPLMFLVAGLLGAGAMILPGVSGGYVLLLLGQYVPVLGAIDAFKQALTSDPGPDWSAALGAFWKLLPLAVGVGLGVVVVSNVLEWALARYEKFTLGSLLGLLLGAVLGIWPYQRPVAPLPGDVVKGMTQTPETIAALKMEDWPTEYFTPGPGHAFGAIALVGLGLAITWLVGRLGSPRVAPDGR